MISNSKASASTSKSASPSKSLRLSSLLLLLLLSACSNGRFTYLDQKFEIDNDNIPLLTLDDSKGHVEIDLHLEDYAHDTRRFHEEVIEAIQQHPGIILRNISASGEEAFRVPRVKSSKAAPYQVKLSFRHNFQGHWYNYFLGFPGMVIICGTWLGYFYELDLRLSGEISSSEKGPIHLYKDDLFLELREKNAPRSIAFHYWPTNGVLGTQFAIGVFMSLALINYEPDYSTPLLLKTMKPIFGPHFASRLYEELIANRKNPALTSAALKKFRSERSILFE